MYVYLQLASDTKQVYIKKKLNKNSLSQFFFEKFQIALLLVLILFGAEPRRLVVTLRKAAHDFLSGGAAFVVEPRHWLVELASLRCVFLCTENIRSQNSKLAILRLYPPKFTRLKVTSKVK